MPDECPVCGSQECRAPVKYRMTVEEWPFGAGFYNTAYYCEEHKPILI